MYIYIYITYNILYIIYVHPRPPREAQGRTRICQDFSDIGVVTDDVPDRGTCKLTENLMNKVWAGYWAETQIREEGKCEFLYDVESGGRPGRQRAKKELGAGLTRKLRQFHL